MFLHSTAAIVLLVPILMPLATEIGLDPVHFGVLFTANLGGGGGGPPVASVLMTACSIAGESMSEVTRVNIYFIAALVLVVLLVTFFPALSLFLPNLLVPDG
jgi:TRAP-type C4-dicarboxylate transport system permease large subunit